MNSWRTELRAYELLAQVHGAGAGEAEADGVLQPGRHRTPVGFSVCRHMANIFCHVV